MALEQALALAPELVERWRELSLLHAARDDAAACDAAKNRQQNVRATCRYSCAFKVVHSGKLRPRRLLNSSVSSRCCCRRNALEDRSPWFIVAFAASCALGSVYGFLQGAWPFGVVEAIWATAAVRRWWIKPKS